MIVTPLSPTRLPDLASVEEVLASVAPDDGHVGLVRALDAAFPPFTFTAASLHDHWWRNGHAVLTPDGRRVTGDYPAWARAELDAIGGDVGRVFASWRDAGHRVASWAGTAVYAFARTGQNAGDYLQIAIGLETERLAGPLWDAWATPETEEDLLGLGWVPAVEPGSPALGPSRYRLLGRSNAGVIHVRTFVERCRWVERERREAERPRLEQRVVHQTVGSLDGRPLPPRPGIPFLELVPDYFDVVPREVRFLDDWAASSAAAHPVHALFALDAQDRVWRGERTIGFIPRPHRQPSFKITADDVDTASSVHALMDRIEAVDRALGTPFGWYFLMLHGTLVDRSVGETVAAGLRSGKVRLPASDEAVLLAWADDPYGF